MTELNPRFAAEARTSSGEVPFQVHEMFFTRTDKRGVIRAGNEVFQRLTGYNWDDLLGAPHKVIRHPDMPKGVFQLMWDTLKSDKPIGAYVKNRDKSGRFYWVFAIIIPIDDGYMSVRIKPTSELCEKVGGIYTELLEREKSENLSPSDSAVALVEAIQGMGYGSYNSFQSWSLAQEFEARSERMGVHLDQMQRRLLMMARGIQQVQVETTEMTEAFKAIRTVPMNMRIIASRLENAGGPISAISVNYSQMLEEMSTWVNTFVEGEACVFARIRDAILTSQFLGFASALEAEMLEAAQSDGAVIMPEDSVDNEITLMTDARQKFLNETSDALVSVENEAMRFGRSVLDMKRYVTGLSSTRMMCKIESAALSGSGEQLDACQTEIEERLAKIVELNAVIQSNTSMLRSLV